MASDFTDRTANACAPKGFMHTTKALIEIADFSRDRAHEESSGSPDTCRTSDSSECRVRTLSGRVAMASTAGLDSAEAENGRLPSGVSHAEGDVLVEAREVEYRAPQTNHHPP